MTETPTVGGHLALDLLNTESRDEGRVVDHWDSDQDVYRWLVQHEIAPTDGVDSDAPPGLLTQGRNLRALVRRLVVARKAGESPELDGLNDFLQAYVTSPTIRRMPDGSFALARISRVDSGPGLLGPVAEAAAQLLVEGDFALVRQCEHSDCILWFYDRTKSHKRRWCSMSVCGNRQKAERFRKRGGGQGAGARGTG
ncbi:hypothetical protein CNR27_14315 [Luteimonas chenhongjianii]|uniref:Zinc finger CGNR domain-containing protein n=1 Tax=Luteimonas chenhongjianii TaxID=2006110 RepID=A0A290XHB1_9GAMM|nr:hypothetical protein CNR27_14315 [Luteimonas chenhongjianii]